MADNKIFREKSLERISSPEQLNEYIKVSSPGVWMAMAAVIVFLIGALVWAINGRVDVYVPAMASAKSGVTSIYVPCDEIDTKIIDENITFKTDTGKYTLSSTEVTVEPVEVTREVLSSMDTKVIYQGNIQEGDWIYILKGKSHLDDGVFECRVVSEEYAPIKFITN